MSVVTNLDLVAVHRFDIESRAIELERALEGAYLDSPVRGMRGHVRSATQARAGFDWIRSVFIDRRTA